MATENYSKPPEMGSGLIPRPANRPLGCSAPVFNKPLIPRDEWGDRIEEKRKHKAMLSDVRNIMGENGGMIPALNQGRDPWCWAFSPVTAITLARANAGLPYQHLSANAVANKITGFNIRGGWSEDAMEHMQQLGAPETAFWPEQSNMRHFDNPDTWENAKQQKITEWWDIDPRDIDSIMTCLLLNYPVAVDIPAWAHSVCLIDPVNAPRNLRDIKFDHLNSWGNNWNGNGIGQLSGEYTKFSSAIACTVPTGE